MLQQGTDAHCGCVRDLKTGHLLLDCIFPSVEGFEWSADGRALWYSIPDDLGRPFKVMRHTVSTTQAEDVMVFQEDNPSHFVTLTRTKDGLYVLINTHAKLSSEVYLLDAHEPHLPPHCVKARQPGLEYFVEHHKGSLLILSNANGANNYCLMTTAAPHGGATASPGGGPGTADATDGVYRSHVTPVGVTDSWRVLVSEQPDVAITDLDVFEGHAVLHQLYQGRPALSIVHLNDSKDAGVTVRSVDQVSMIHQLHKLFLQQS